MTLLWSTWLRAEEFDVLVYGATPAGIAAALAAGEQGAKVLLIEPTDWVGGMVTNGLSHTDFRTFESLTGFYLRFCKRVEAHYAKTYGGDSAQFRECLRGTNAEPKVNRLVFEEMLAETPKVRVQTGWSLEGIRTSAGGNGISNDSNVRSIEMLLFCDGASSRHSITAHYFIDATYEGDLLAAAEVPYHVGREARAAFNESLAPEQADEQLQAYNYRLILTQSPENRVMARRPEGYERELFTGLLPLLASGQVKRLFDSKPPALFKAQLPHLPNGKFDINDVSHAPVRLSLPGENSAWPDGLGGAAIRSGPQRDTLKPPFSKLGLETARESVCAAHKLWNVGLLYFLQNDEAVPAAFREEARSWGYARDEFRENHYLPAQLYVREARRMRGEYVFSQHDVACAGDDVRAVLHTDAIAAGDYGPNCHGTGHESGRFAGKHTGEFYQPSPPYQIPYGVLLPVNIDNLLVPCAVSATHVGFCALRFEPIWASLGEAAGYAAFLANQVRGTVQTVDIKTLQRQLHRKGGATLYVSDVAPGDTLFEAVQWWGTLGGFHGLHQRRGTAPGERGPNISGQYFEAFPKHAAELSKAMDADLTARWEQLAATAGIAPSSLRVSNGTRTRGDWLRAAWSARDTAIPTQR